MQPCHLTRGLALSCDTVRLASSELPVLLVLQQLAVPAGQRVAGLAEELQRLLLVNGTEDGPLPRRADRIWTEAERREKRR